MIVSIQYGCFARELTIIGCVTINVTFLFDQQMCISCQDGNHRSHIFIIVSVCAWVTTVTQQLFGYLYLKPSGPTPSLPTPQKDVNAVLHACIDARHFMTQVDAVVGNVCLQGFLPEGIFLSRKALRSHGM